MQIITRIDNGMYDITSFLLEKESPVGYGKEARVIIQQSRKATTHFTLPYFTQTDLHKFCSLAITWKEETKHLSSTSQICLNLSYQQIIGMGNKAIAFILKDLILEQNQWFWALKAITGEDPVDPGDVGNINKMTTAWLNWGIKNGYIE